MQQCKGFNRDGSKCNRKTKSIDGNFCWQHCEQFLDQGGAVAEPKKVFKMPVEISIDNYQVEIDSLKSDVEFMAKKFETGAEPETLEEMSEFAHKTFRMQELCKAVEQLEQKKKDNFKEEKQFRVLVHNVPKNQSFQTPQTDRLVESAGFKRAIDFEIRKLNSRQKKLDNKRKAIKDVKTVKNVEDD
jgi:hypothetical protein